MPISLGFGSRKSRQETEIDRELEEQRQISETGTQAQVGTTQQQQTGTTRTTGTQTQEQETRQDVTAAGQAQRTGQTTAQTQQFTDQVLAGLNQLFAQGIAGTGAQDTLAALTSASASRALDFDAEAFVQGRVGTAQQQFEDVVLPSLRTAASAVGGTASTNSAVNLLTQIAADRQARTLADVEASASAEAENIIRQNLTSAAGIAGQETQSLAAIGELLRGAFTEQTGVTEEATATEQQTAQTGIQSGTQTSQSEQQTQEELLSIIQQLLATNRQTEEQSTVREEQDISGRSRGSGFNIGLNLGG